MLIEQARRALKSGQKSRAEALLFQAVQEDPDNFRAWLLLAAATSSPQKSLEYVQRADMLAPDNPSVAKARLWAEDRLAKANEAQPPPPSANQRNWMPWLWGTAVFLIIGLGGITAVLLVTQWFMFASANRSPRQIADNRPTPIVETTATPTSYSPVNPPLAAAEPRSQSKQIAPGDLNDPPRPEWTITPTPTNTPTPTPTLVPTYLAPQNSKPAMRPFGVAQGEPWIDVDLSSQTLNAYEGNDLVYTTRVSSGLNEFPTVTGMFRIWLRLESQTMDGTRLGYDYYLENVPYVMYFFEDYALHGAYWHNNFGYPMSHGCVNLSPADARWLYEWSAYGTVVNVHH